MIFFELFRDIIKNLVIGYLKVNTNERKQVLKLIGSMLNFQPHDYEQIEQTGLTSKWLSGMFSGGQASSRNPSKGDALNKSFTELLIQYVDRESKPIPRVSLDVGQSQQQSAGSLLLSSKQHQQPNTGLLIGATNKKTDHPLFFSTTPLQQQQQQQIFNPQTQSASILNRSNTFPVNTLSGISSSTQLGLNISNRFTPSPTSTLSNNNNTFLEDALNN